MSGRQFSLETIRKDHLIRMDKLNILRKLDPSKMPVSDIKSFLDNHGECLLATASLVATVFSFLAKN